MFHRIQDDKGFLDSVIFSYESTFYVSGKVSTHNCRIWGSENSHAFLEYVCVSPKENVFCAHCKECTAPCSSWKRPLPISCICLDMLKQFLILQLDEDHQERRIHFQQDSTPLHYLGKVWEYLSTSFSGRWIGRAVPIACTSFPGSYTPGIFLMGVFAPTLPANVTELRTRSTATVAEVSHRCYIELERN
jgi:hypothetical protein